MKRRHFIQNVLTASLTYLFPSSYFALNSYKRLNLLMLGGTDFVGPHFVNQALRRGHTVTIFNRGITNPYMFPNLEFIKGNRYPDLDNGLNGLSGSRKWDIVIDTWQGPPGCVSATAQLLKNRVSHYIYISSIATYKNYKNHKMTEESALLDMTNKMDSFSEDIGYAERKRASEQAVMKYNPTSGSILRCGSIRGESYNPNFGPEDFYHHHMRLGNTLVLPNDTEAKFQLIDVKDLANFGLNIIENNKYGTYNMVGPQKQLNFKEYLQTIHEATDNLSKIYWVDLNWLTSKNVRPWDDLPNYIPLTDPEPGFYTIDNTKAINAGLTFRPIYTTIVESLGNISIDQLKNQKFLSGMDENRRLQLIEEIEH